MVSLENYGKFLYSMNPQRSLSRLVLYNYLRHYCELSSPLSPDFFEQSFDLLLNNQYWVNHHQNLGQTTRSDLIAFCEKYALGFSASDIEFCDQIQYLRVASDLNYKALLEKSLKSNKQTGDRFKVFKGKDEMHWTCIYSHSSGDLSVSTYLPMAKIQEGELRVMSPLTQLRYDNNLELKGQTRHRVSTSLLSQQIFQIRDGMVSGVELEGHHLQKHEAFTNVELQSRSTLFYAIKRLESKFLQTESDNFYQELVHWMERANRLYDENHPERERIAEKALERGRKALQELYTEDKLLLLLVRNLEYKVLAQGHSSKPSSTGRSVVDDPAPSLDL